MKQTLPHLISLFDESNGTLKDFNSIFNAKLQGNSEDIVTIGNKYTTDGYYISIGDSKFFPYLFALYEERNNVGRLVKSKTGVRL